jgi:hypothetical protein
MMVMENQTFVTEWVSRLVAGECVGVYSGSKLLFEAKIIRVTPTGMVVCEPGGTFKPSGHIHGRLADQSRRIRPLPVEADTEAQGL